MPDRAQRLAVMAIVLDLFTFAIGIGFVFVAIGHDANSATECATANGLCPQRIDQGSVTCTIPVGSNGCTPPAVTFNKAFPTAPHVSLTFTRDDYGGLTGSLFPDTVTMLAPGNVAETWTAQPAATTEIFGTSSNRGFEQDVGAVTETFTVNTVSAGVAGSVLEVQNSPDQTTWTDPCTVAGTADVPISLTGVQQRSCAVSITANAFTRIVGKNGNGVASPGFGLIQVSYSQGAISLFTGWFFSSAPTTTGFAIALFTTLGVTAAQGVQTETLHWKAESCTNGALVTC